MKIPICPYVPPNASPADLSRVLQLLATLFGDSMDGRIDARNIDPDMYDPDSFDFFTPTDKTKPKILYTPLTSPDNPPYIRKKGPTVGNKAGIEFVVDASDATYGRVCVVDSNDPAEQQIISLIPDAYTATNPGGTLKTPLGNMTIDTGTGFIIQARKQVAWADGLGPFTQLKGPSDESFWIESGSAGKRTYIGYRGFDRGFFVDGDGSGCGFQDQSAHYRWNIPNSSVVALHIRGKNTSNNYWQLGFGGSNDSDQTFWVGIGSHSTGNIEFTDGTDTGRYFVFDGPNLMMDWGGTSSSFPALKRSSAILQARLADDSAFATLEPDNLRIHIGSASNYYTFAGAPGGTRTKTLSDRSGTIFDSGGENAYATGLGALTSHLTGPGDQDYYLTNASPTSGNPGKKTILAAAPGVGSNQAGGELSLKAGASTGNATGGAVILYVSRPGGSGSSANSLFEVARVSSIGGVQLADQNGGTGPEASVFTGPTDATVQFQAGTPIQGTSTKAGRAAQLKASSATPGSSSAGAAAGGTVSVVAGNADRLTSGNANGGDVQLQPGTGIGTGVTGDVDFRKSTVALGGGAGATLGTIGGSGPGTAAQNAWMQLKVNGTIMWFPVWL